MPADNILDVKVTHRRHPLATSMSHMHASQVKSRWPNLPVDVDDDAFVSLQWHFGSTEVQIKFHSFWSCPDEDVPPPQTESNRGYSAGYNRAHESDRRENPYPADTFLHQEWAIGFAQGKEDLAEAAKDDQWADVEGWHHALAGGQPEDNPYPDGSELHQDWNQGFAKATEDLAEAAADTPLNGPQKPVATSPVETEEIAALRNWMADISDEEAHSRLAEHAIKSLTQYIAASGPICPECGSPCVVKLPDDPKHRWGCRDCHAAWSAAWPGGHPPYFGDIPHSPDDEAENRCPECGGWNTQPVNPEGTRMECLDCGCGSPEQTHAQPMPDYPPEHIRRQRLEGSFGRTPCDVHDWKWTGAVWRCDCGTVAMSQNPKYKPCDTCDHRTQGSDVCELCLRLDELADKAHAQAEPDDLCPECGHPAHDGKLCEVRGVPIIDPDGDVCGCDYGSPDSGIE